MSERGRRFWARRPKVIERRILIIAPLLVVVVLVVNSYAYFAREFAAKNMSGHNIVTQALVPILMIYDALLVTTNSFMVSFDQQPLSETSPIPTVHLRVEPGSLDRLTADLPTSAKARYYKARMLYPDGKWRRVKYRLRGSGRWHWDTAKPSIKVKLRKSAPLGLQRHLHFISPEDRTMVTNYIDERVARGMGVLTNKTTFTRLFINGQYRGIYHRTSHKDESTLRLRRRMPGPIYEGRGLHPRWRAEDFELHAVGDLPHRFDPLKEMTDAIYLPEGPDRYLALWGVLSFDRYARYVAYMNLVSAIHGDFTHNHLFYFNPVIGRIEPWVIDSNGHGMLLLPRASERLTRSRKVNAEVPLNELMTPLLDAVLRDPRFLHRRNIHLYRAIEGSGSVINRREMLNGLYQRLDADILADRHKGALEMGFIEPYRLIYSNGQFEDAKRRLYDWIGRRDDFLRRELANVVVRVWLEAPASDGRTPFTVEVSGQVAVNFDTARVVRSTGGNLTADRDLDGDPETSVSGLLLLTPGLVQTEAPKSIYLRRRQPVHSLTPGPERYRLAGPIISAAAFKAAFTNAVTGAPVIPKVIDGPAPTPTPSVSIHPWRFPAERTDDVILGPGDVTLNDTLYVGRGQHLTIHAGTRLRLGPRVSIISRGRLSMVGTSASPITVERADPAKPWGVIAIQGAGANASIIDHARISGGSLTRQDNISYSGMVSVHGVDGFKMRNSEISRNVGSDDTLHIVNSTFSIEDSVLSDCYADCIDLDFADGVISGLTVTNAGNDGIDFMTSNVELNKIILFGAEDKGLSIGEASRITAQDVQIAGAKTAIAVKDASHATLRGATLTRNETAIHIFAKNWRYGGPGRLTVRDTRFIDNHVDLRTEKKNTVEFIDQAPPGRIDGPANSGGNQTPDISPESGS